MLSLLVESPRHGYEIIRTIEERTRGAYAPSAGVVYPTLNLLEEQSWVTGLGADESGKRRFAATDTGRAHAQANDSLIQGAFARLDMVARMRAREALPARVRQAMETLKQALFAQGNRWDDAEADRVAAAIEFAALVTVDPTARAAATASDATVRAGLPPRAPQAPNEEMSDATVKAGKGAASDAGMSASTSVTMPASLEDVVDPASAARFMPQRVRHPLTARMLQVKRVTRVARHLVSITLTGDDLPGFLSASFDDHVKVFFPRDGETTPRMPDLTDLKRRHDDPAQRPIARDYTPRRYDPIANELDIEFVLHASHGSTSVHDTTSVSDEGRGAGWAGQAQVGDLLGIAGPRGSFVVPNTFDWYLLAGDDTALPAIGRRIEELPATCTAWVFAEVATLDDLPQWPSRPNVHVTPVLRGDVPAGSSDALVKAVRAAVLPSGIGHAWVAAESGAARAVRSHLVDERGFDKQHVRAASYWRSGASNQHESLDG
jgi:NADPH-dependent ferric siderophore reductase/DNA-binding PadR family transcriptional regulator